MPDSYVYRYPRPSVTADAVLLVPAADGAGEEILLVRRGREPFAGRWALPGGFMEMEETTEACARRELAEETGVSLDALPFRRVGVYDDPPRDPRGRTISVAYLVRAPRGLASPRAGDDAAEARFFPVSALPPLAFDHDAIVRDALRLAATLPEAPQ